jgi:hypothetical protein
VTSITYKTGVGATIGTLNYGYDADGRRVSVGGSLARTNLPLAQSFSYYPDNSLETLGSITVINDNDGNITCMSTTCPQFSYDARGNLQQAVPNGVTLDYSYDALGRRYKFATGLTTTTYQYDGLNPVDTLFDGYLRLLICSALVWTTSSSPMTTALATPSCATPWAPPSH